MPTVPPPEADDLHRLIFQQAGVLTTAQVAEVAGLGIARSRLRQGRWRRICQGVLLTENGRLRRDQQLWVAVLTAGPEARLAGRTAAAEGGVHGLRPGPIQVIIPAARRRSVRLPHLPADMSEVLLHRTAVLPAAHLQAARPPRTSTARSVIDGAAWAASDDEARDLIARACQQRRATPGELREVLGLFPRIRRHRLIATTIADVEGGAEALSEIDLVALCRRFGLPHPDQQERRTDAAGGWRFADAYWRDQRLLVEVDGGYHLDVRQWSDDMLRQNEIWLAGDRILRFPAWLVRADPAAVAEQLRAALASPVRGAQA
jgi:hypothetical protein